MQAVMGWDMEALALPQNLHKALAGRKSGAIRSVEAEGARRFVNSRVMEYVQLQNTRFTREVHRIVKHMIAHCEWTSEMDVEIVQGGGARQSLVVGGRQRRVFKVHEKWFDAEAIAEDLGVSWSTDADGIFAVSKALFSEMLDSLKNDEVEPYREDMEDKPREWKLRSEKSRWEQRVRVVTSAKPVTIEPYTLATATVVVKWQVPVEWRRQHDEPCSAEIEVQVHSVETCDEIRFTGVGRSKCDHQLVATLVILD